MLVIIINTTKYELIKSGISIEDIVSRIHAIDICVVFVLCDVTSRVHSTGCS